MNTSDVIAGLKLSLATWSAEAAKYIFEHLQESVMIASGSIWVHVGAADYQESTPILTLKPESYAKLRELPSYLALDEAVRQSNVLSPMLGHMVGTRRSASPFSTWTLANAFLPRINDLITGHGPSFGDRYEVISRQLADRQIEYEAICPIQGLGFGLTPIELAEDLTIERLSPAEICLALEVNAIPTMFSSHFRPDDGNSFALKKRVSVPVMVSEPDRQEEVRSGSDTAELFIRLLRTFEDVVALQQCLALMTDENIQVSAILIAATDGGFLGSDTGTQRQLISASWKPDSGLRFDPSRCADLQRIWRISHGDSLPRNKALGLAWRRLAFATQRTMPEDRLLDVFIAAEAFYRAQAYGKRDRSRPRLQLSQRAAVWSEGSLPGWSKDEVLQQIDAGYKVRNAVAHGDEPEAKDLNVKGQQASLNEVARAVETIVRAGLYKAIQQLPETSGQLAISRDDLLPPTST